MTNIRIKRVFIANRGEIALRIQRACDAVSIESVVPVSPLEKESFFVRQTHNPVFFEQPDLRKSYLNIPLLISMAREHGCDAVHPGYGFLSENAEFARAVRKAGLNFIGPSAEAIESLGDKINAREIMTSAGVPCVPGVVEMGTDQEVIQSASKIGFPVILKAAAGGGGKGMRICRNDSELETALPLVRSEAGRSFGSETVYVEKYLEKPRHIEVQVFGDSRGNYLHFGTRECSLQRRHQKLVEEAPAPNLSDSLREEIHQAGITAAKAVNYENAGTIEFLVSEEKFYFLEMNTRIQVEHPVTEEVTGIDLVQLQLEVASGNALPMKQEEVSFSGSSIEFRISAEDTAVNFIPSPGVVEKIFFPEKPFLRIDTGVGSGDEVSGFFDPLLLKMIISGETRSEALDRSLAVLHESIITGIETTLPFHKWVVSQEDFRNAQVDTGFVERIYTGASSALQQREGIDCLEQIELFRYRSSRFQSEYIVEVIYEQGGTYIARPRRVSGTVGRNRYCRRSDVKDVALQSLIKEVLEEVEEVEIFAGNRSGEHSGGSVSV